MNILPIQSYLYKNPIITNVQSSGTVGASPILPNQRNIDIVNFRGVHADAAATLKSLAQFGVFDMYTGKMLITPQYLQKLQYSKTFDKPLKELLPILKKQEKCMYSTDIGLLKILEKVAEKKPDIKINEALLELKSEHEKKLLKQQQPVFEKLIQAACDLPEKSFSQFMNFMKLTNKRLAQEPVILPFSEKTFIYKLMRVKEQILSKNNPKEISAINNLIRSSRVIFEVNNITPRKYRGIANREKRLKYQSNPEILKRNATKLQCLQDIFNSSVIRNNNEIKQIFYDSSARIHGFPLQAPFKRKEFVHDLKGILRNVENKDLVHRMVRIAHSLPTSKDSVSAFIVKSADETSDKIGFYLLKDYICSVDHIKAKNQGGKNKRKNYGLCSVYINSQKTNIPFDVWCRKHPETYKNCQKYIDRLIELYNKGIFAKVGLDKSYLYEFAETIKELSPAEKPLILDLSNLN